MTWRVFAAVVVSWGLSWAALSAQTTPNKNPLEGNPDAILAGMGGYRVRCADCHGLDGRGVRGPDITQVWNSGRTDDGLFKTIRSGVPGPEIAAVVAPRTYERDPSQIPAYLKTSTPPPPAAPGVSSAAVNPRPSEGRSPRTERYVAVVCSAIADRRTLSS